MFVQAALIAAQLWLGEITRQRPKRTKFEDFVHDNAPSEIRPIPYAGGTIELTPSRQWYGDFLQRAVERDSHWTDYLWAGALAGLLDFITVAYRSYVGEMFPLCWGPDAHVERITINERLMFQAVQGTDNAGGGFLIDDPQAWGGDQPPGEGGEYAWCDLTRGNYTDPTNAYIESLLTTAPNRTPALHGISTLIKRGPSGFTESGYFHAGGVGVTPHLKAWKVVIRRQPDNLATGFHRIGRHMNPMETIYEWSTSLEYGAKIPLQYLNLDNWRAVAQQLYDEGTGWSGRIENQTSPIAVVKDVLAQIDAVDEASPSLGLTIRLVRRDYSFGSLRVLNRDNVTRVERFTPGTYEDTKNKVQVEFPDQDNNFKDRKALYIDPANQLIQDGRIVPETKTFLGVADFEQANVIATRDGRALSLPRAPLECFVFPSFGRLAYRGEVMKFEWESPTFSLVMRVLAITPNGPDERDYRLLLIEDQFATGLRTFGESGPTEHLDPGAGLDTAPPSASWNDADFAPDGLTLTLTLTNTNQFQPTIQGGIVFGSYAPGGQYARIYVREPGGVQTLSPMRLIPDINNEATFQWPAFAVGEYQFCVQAFSTRGATNGVKVCVEIVVSAIGSPSLSPSSSISLSPSSSVSPSSSESASVSPSPSTSPSVSPSSSVSASVSPSASISPSSSSSPSPSPSSSISPSPSASSSVSPSASQSPSASASPSHSASASLSPSSSASLSLSPSASTSPSSSASPSADTPPPVSGMTYWLDANQETGYSDGDAVNPIKDWSGNGNDISQATSTKRARWNTGMSNARAAYRFDGVDDSMDLPTSVSDSAWTLYVVLRPQQVNNTGDKTIIGPSLTSGIQVGLRHDTHKIRLAQSGVTGFGESNATLSDSVFTVIVIARDTSEILIRLNGALDNTLGAFSTFNPFGRLAYTNTGNPLILEVMEGWIAELLLYPTKHNSTDISNMEAWLLDRH